MNLNKDPSSWARVVPDAALHGSRAQQINVVQMAIEDIARLSAQLDRANKIIGWMMPYIGSMCPPQNGLGELNDHCFDNYIRPRMDDETKGPSIRQHAAGARPSGVIRRDTAGE